ALPPGATFDPETMELRWTPDNAQAGDYELRFRATDTGDGDEPPLSTEITVPTRVVNQNRRPEVRTIENAPVAKNTVAEIPAAALHHLHRQWRRHRRDADRAGREPSRRSCCDRDRDRRRRRHRDPADRRLYLHHFGHEPQRSAGDRPYRQSGRGGRAKADGDD